MRDVIVWVVGVCVLALVVPPANAELITINIEGVVDTVDDSNNYLEGQVNPGDIITGWYTYDTATLDSDPLDPVQGNYWHYAPPAGISLTIGGLLFQTDPTNVAFLLAVRNNNLSGDDVYSIGSSVNGVLPSGSEVELIWWQLNDHTGTALASDALPSVAPLLDQWEANVLRIETDRMFYIDAHVTSAVPEPVTFLLLALGAAILTREKP